MGDSLGNFYARSDRRTPSHPHCIWRIGLTVGRRGNILYVFGISEGDLCDFGALKENMAGLETSLYQ